MTKSVWWAALLIGASYMLPVAQSAGLAVFGALPSAGWLILWKGAGVAALSLWAALSARNGFGWTIAAILACGALGDVLVEAFGLTAGAVAFAGGHVLAISLYLRHYRPTASVSQRLLAAVVVPISVYLATRWAPDGEIIVVAIYASLVSAMAASAWISRFSRYNVGIGAMLFLGSDLLIFADMSVSAGPGFLSILIWPLYFAGQAMIAWGVVAGLRKVPPNTDRFAV